MDPTASPERKAALACKNGGVSIFITSLTDAIAFLIGSATVLPALSWFCTFAGLCVVWCFIFQITVFLPCLVLNARRADTGALDCCCCAACCSSRGCCTRRKTCECCLLEPRDIQEPQGCVCCPGPLNFNVDFIKRMLVNQYGRKVATQKK